MLKKKRRSKDSKLMSVYSNDSRFQLYTIFFIGPKRDFPMSWENVKRVSHKTAPRKILDTQREKDRENKDVGI